MLGKRPCRHSMKRTTSMTEFSYDDLSVINNNHTPSDETKKHQNGVTSDHHQKVQIVGSTRTLRRNSADFALESNSSTHRFLRSCSLCNRRLPPGRDIYMYRGDTAFCTLECRQQQMTQDEWSEKCTHKESNSSSHSTPVSSAVSSTKGEKIAAL